jgi:hypothetical protein
MAKKDLNVGKTMPSAPSPRKSTILIGGIMWYVYHSQENGW